MIIDISRNIISTFLLKPTMTTPPPIEMIPIKRVNEEKHQPDDRHIMSIVPILGEIHKTKGIYVTVKWGNYVLFPEDTFKVGNTKQKIEYPASTTMFFICRDLTEILDTSEIWTCQCTYIHRREEFNFLSCKVCGIQRDFDVPSSTLDTKHGGPKYLDNIPPLETIDGDFIWVEKGLTAKNNPSFLTRLIMFPIAT